MKGATEFHRIIQEAAYRKIGGIERTDMGYKRHGGDARCFRNGNVLYVTASHARGETFYIYLIDPDNNNLFEVYGITSGNPGWTEIYGWKYKGTWVKPILQYLRSLEKEIAAYDAEVECVNREREREANKKIGDAVGKFNEMFRCS